MIVCVRSVPSTWVRRDGESIPSANGLVETGPGQKGNSVSIILRVPEARGLLTCDTSAQGEVTVGQVRHAAEGSGHHPAT